MKKKKSVKREIFISDGLHNKLTEDRDKLVKRGGAARLYLLGKNKNNVYDSCVLLHRGGGCRYMPRITTREISNAYLKLVRRNLIPCGFGHITFMDKGHQFSGWGDATYKQLGNVFISYCPNDIRAKVYESSRLRNVNIKIVDKNFKV